MMVYQMKQNLDAQGADLQQSLPFRNLGVSGKATYDYDRRYYAEFAFGYNGSERFASNHRFGFFPSFGFAWSISNERFFEPLKQSVTRSAEHTSELQSLMCISYVVFCFKKKKKQ